MLLHYAFNLFQEFHGRDSRWDAEVDVSFALKRNVRG
jgi:hypothetical protein